MKDLDETDEFVIEGISEPGRWKGPALFVLTLIVVALFWGFCLWRLGR